MHPLCNHVVSFLFTLLFFNDATPTEIYTLSLHDALPISLGISSVATGGCASAWCGVRAGSSRGARSITNAPRPGSVKRSEEHTSELQSQFHLVCRLLLEKKKTRTS